MTNIYRVMAYDGDSGGETGAFPTLAEAEAFAAKERERLKDNMLTYRDGRWEGFECVEIASVVKRWELRDTPPPYDGAPEKPPHADYWADLVEVPVGRSDR